MPKKWNLVNEHERIYVVDAQSTVFLKRPGDGPTHWHSDLNMVPIDTNQFVTIWIPLRPIGYVLSWRSPFCIQRSVVCTVSVDERRRSVTRKSAQSVVELRNCKAVGCRVAAPLTRTPRGFGVVRRDDDSGLEFAGGSHRDFGLPYWHELGFDLETRGYEVESAGAMVRCAMHMQLR